MFGKIDDTGVGGENGLMWVHDHAAEASEGVLESSLFPLAEPAGWSNPQHPLFEAERLPRALFDDDLDDDEDDVDDDEDDDGFDDDDDDLDDDFG